MFPVVGLTYPHREPKSEPSDPPAWHNNLPIDHGNDPAWVAKIAEYLALPDHPEYDSSDDDDRDEAFKDGTWRDEGYGVSNALDWKFNRLRRILHPEPGEEYSYDEWKAGLSAKERTICGYQLPLLGHEYYEVNLERDFRDKGLQVIVRLASVELTPEKPEYSGGNWHLEVSRIPFTRIQNIDTNVLPGNDERA